MKDSKEDITVGACYIEPKYPYDNTPFTPRPFELTGRRITPFNAPTVKQIPVYTSVEKGDTITYKINVAGISEKNLRVQVSSKGNIEVLNTEKHDSQTIVEIKPDDEFRMKSVSYEYGLLSVQIELVDSSPMTYEIGYDRG